jgi:hypothetical protein
MKFIKQGLTSFEDSNITQLYNDWNESITYTYESEDSLTNASVVRYRGYYYRSLTDGNEGNNPEETENEYWVKWQVANTFAMLDHKSLTDTTIKMPTYVMSNSYNAGDIVEYNSKYYISLINSNLGNGPTPTSPYWDIWDDGEVVPDWEGITTYNENDVVRYNGAKYRSRVDSNVGLTPDENVIEWEYFSYKGIQVTFPRDNIDAIGVGNVEAESIEIRHYDINGDEIREAYQFMSFSPNTGVTDYWTYIYEPYTSQLDGNTYIELVPVGVTVEVKINRSGFTNRASCGFLVAGRFQEMGQTLDGVGFNFNSFSTVTYDAFGNLNIVRRNVQDIVDFETIIPRNRVAETKRTIKEIYDEVILFVVDESDDSDFENMVTFGKIENASVVGSVQEQNVISWTIVESI